MADEVKKSLTVEELRLAHHYYIHTPHVAESQVREEAQRRLTDRRKPENSVLHFHPYVEHAPLRCKDEGRHEEYIIEKEETDAE